MINVADHGKSPAGGYAVYLRYPGATRPRWGDYSWAIYVPGPVRKIYFASNYIQYLELHGVGVHADLRYMRRHAGR